MNVRAPAPRKLFIRLGTRLTVPVVLLVAAVAVGAYFGLVRTFRTTALRSKEAAADMVVKLTTIAVMPAVVFGDEVEMQRAVDALAKNEEVTDVELWGVAPEGLSPAPLAKFHRDNGGGLERPGQAASLQRSDAASVILHEPVVSQDGKRVGLLAVRFSTQHEAEALAALSREILYVSLGTALGLAVAILLVLTRLVVSPIQRLQRAAERLARGDGDAAVVDAIVRPGRVEDEVVSLASAFKGMAEAVRDREQRLAVRNGELRLILDSVDQGFVTALPDGTLLPERSAIIETWLGKLPEEIKYWELAALVEPSAQSWARGAWQQVTDGWLPLEAAVDQLPKRLVHAGRHFDFAYHPVMTQAEVDRVVIVLTDVTAEVERQRAVAEQHEFSVLVDQFVRDRRAFYDFWNEACGLVERILATEAGSEALRRDLHTLKGNARYFGLKRLASHCHALEDAMAERVENSLTAAEKTSLAEAWGSLSARIDPLLNGATAFIEISEEEYGRLSKAVQSGEPHATLADLVRGLKQEPTAWRLGRARDTLLSTCAKLGRAPVDVVIDDGGIRLPPGRLAPFWSVFSHVLANAIDHGIEPDEVRREKGKKVPGTITLRTFIEKRELVVQVADDGAGIDWERLRDAAKAKGLPHASRRELVNALLSDGFSLKASVSEVSGRGVGLSAVGNVVAAMGGRVELDGAPDAGATWRFRLPVGRLDSDDEHPPTRAAPSGADVGAR
ncbi:MAG TPA: ATP-binding protein [Polyangiaceae bacterium]|nr:ATP-binding protein [Polyangiaceae bacterium]